MTPPAEDRIVVGIGPTGSKNAGVPARRERHMPVLHATQTKPEQTFGQVCASDRAISVLAVGSVEEDHRDFRKIVKDLPFRVSVRRDFRGAAALLDRQQFGIVVCDCNLPDGGWTDLLEKISKEPEPPLLIVSSRLADDFLWAEVLNLGAFDLLMTPFNRQDVRHVLTTASIQLRNQARRTASVTGVARD
jgi:DNA-binding NtrC family response regulator